LTTLYLTGAKTLTVGMPGRGICSVLLPLTFQWFHHPRKPTVATKDAHSSINTKLT
jgi:hypothetical protein